MRLAFAGILFGIATWTVVFAAIRGNVYIDLVVLFWLAPASIKTLIDISRVRFGPVKTLVVYSERLTLAALALIFGVVGSMVSMAGFVAVVLFVTRSGRQSEILICRS